MKNYPRELKLFLIADEAGAETSAPALIASLASVEPKNLVKMSG